MDVLFSGSAHSVTELLSKSTLNILPIHKLEVLQSILKTRTLCVLSCLAFIGQFYQKRERCVVVHTVSEL